MQKTPDLSVHNRCFGALIAQNARVPNGYEPKGRGFESLLAYQKRKIRTLSPAGTGSDFALLKWRHRRCRYFAAAMHWEIGVEPATRQMPAGFLQFHSRVPKQTVENEPIAKKSLPSMLFSYKLSLAF